MIRVNMKNDTTNVGMIGWVAEADFSFNINLQPLNHQS